MLPLNCMAMKLTLGLAVCTLFQFTSAQLPHVKCHVKHKKVGCFVHGSKNTILFTDRLMGIPNNKGHEIDWYNWEAYLHSLACRCNEDGRIHGYKYFYLGYFGECYGSIDYPSASRISSSGCITHSYVSCVDSSNLDCVGTANTQYVYEVGQDGGYTDWGEFSACSTTCGDGVQVRTRNCTNPSPSGFGKDCSHIGPQTDSRACNLRPCIIDGGFSNWTWFGECSKTCDGGYRTRYRFCNNPKPQGGGRNCTGPYVDTEYCANDLCKGPVGVSKAETIVESFLVNFHNSTYPTKKVSGKFHQAIFAIQKAVANEFAQASNKSLETRLNDLRKFLKVATSGGSIDFARTTLGKSLFVFMKKKIEEGLPIDAMDKAAKNYLESIKKDIGSKKFGELMLEEGGATLMFSVDTTGSMTDDINSAKAIAQYIVNMRRKFPVDFILSLFNDPNVGPVTYKNESQKLEFVNLISNIPINGGGDCPELSFTGMLNALKAGPKLGSPMYVFTDASAKDATEANKQLLKDHALQYNSAITFFTHLLGCGDSNGIKSYEEIAAYTSGQIFPLQMSSDLLKFKEFVENSLKNKDTIDQGVLPMASSSITTGKKRGARTMLTRYVTVDDNIATLIISISAKQRGVANYVSLKKPDASSVSAQSSTSYTRVFSISHPSSGRWRMEYPTGQPISFVVSAISDRPIDFQNYYMLQESADAPILTIQNPLIGRQGPMVIRISNADLLNSSSLELDIVDGNSVVLSSGLKLQKLGGGAFETKLLPPTTSFKLALKGRTKSGHAFQRLSNRLSEPQKAVMVALGAGEEFTASVSSGISKINVYMYNEGEVEQFQFRGVANYGTISIATSTQVLQKQSNATLEFSYSPSSTAASYIGKTDAVTLKANGAKGNNIHLTFDLLLVH
eukprot:gene5644-6340_t